MKNRTGSKMWKDEYAFHMEQLREDDICRTQMTETTIFLAWIAWEVTAVILYWIKEYKAVSTCIKTENT